MFFRCGAKNTINGDNIEFLPNLPSTNVLGIAELNGELYCATFYTSDSSQYLNGIYKLTDNTWTKVLNGGSSYYVKNDFTWNGYGGPTFVSCNGSIYGIGYYKFDGETLSSTNYSSGYYYERTFPYGNKLYIFYYSSSYYYMDIFDTESNKTVKSVKLPFSHTSIAGSVVGYVLNEDNIFVIDHNTNKIYSFNSSDDTWTQNGESSEINDGTSIIRYNDKIHFIGKKAAYYVSYNTYEPGPACLHQINYKSVNSIFSLLIETRNPLLCVYNNKLIVCNLLLGSTDSVGRHITAKSSRCLSVDLKGE